MSTVNAIINENKITAQTIQRLIKASGGSAEGSAEGPCGHPGRRPGGGGF